MKTKCCNRRSVQRNVSHHNMSRPRTYPNELFVSVEEEGTDDEYLRANKDAEICAEIGVKKRVGRYVLAEVIHVEGKVVTSGASLQCHPSLRRK